MKVDVKIIVTGFDGTAKELSNNVLAGILASIANGHTSGDIRDKASSDWIGEYMLVRTRSSE